MKITVTIDASDLYTEDESFTDAVKHAVALEVKRSIINDFKDKVGLEFNKQVAEEVKKQK